MKTAKRFAALLLALCMVFSLSACQKKPTAADAEKYVKAVLNIMCTGENDNSVKLVDADEIAATREESIDSVIDTMREQLYMTDEVAAEFRDVISTMFSKVRFTVGKAVPADGGFDVPVTMEPLSFSEPFGNAVNEGVEVLRADPSVQGMTEDEIMNELMRYAVGAMREELKNPHYGEPVVVSVHYHEMEKGLYGVDGEDGQELGALMFF